MTKYRINKGFIVQKLGTKTTIFDSEKSVIYTFNETASFIFDKLKNQHEDIKIAKALVKKYGIKLYKANNDIKELVGNLKSKKILS